MNVSRAWASTIAAIAGTRSMRYTIQYQVIVATEGPSPPCFHPSRLEPFAGSRDGGLSSGDIYPGEDLYRDS